MRCHLVTHQHNAVICDLVDFKGFRYDRSFHNYYYHVRVTKHPDRCRERDRKKRLGYLRPLLRMRVPSR